MLPTVTDNLSTEAKSQLMQAKDNEYNLLYFPFHGVVPCLRAMLAMSGEKYTMIHPEDWATEKPITPLGHMPVLYETNRTTGETIAMAETIVLEFYLAKKFGLMGANAYEDHLIQMYHNSIVTVFDTFVTTVVRQPKELQPQTMVSFLTKTLPEWAHFHEKALVANGSNGHYVGEGKTTLCDLKLASVLQTLMAIQKDVEVVSKEKTPAMIKVLETVEAIPEYAAWKSSEAFKTYTVNTRKLFGL